MRLIWSEDALADLSRIRDFIAEDSEYYAAGFVQRLIDSAGILQSHPLIGQVVHELKKYEIRQLIFHNYRLLYRVSQDSVDIVTVVHAGRDLSSYEPKPWDVS